MKIKKIRIMPQDKFNSSLLTLAKQIDRGKKVKPSYGEYFESLEAIRNFLTEKRLDLWRIVRDKQPDSISELAEMVQRNFKNVHADINILVEVGLIELKKPKHSKTRALKPVSIVDQLEFKVA